MASSKEALGNINFDTQGFQFIFGESAVLSLPRKRKGTKRTGDVRDECTFRRGAGALPMRLYSANHKMGRKGREAGRALVIQESNASACGHVSKQVELQCTPTAAAVTGERPSKRTLQTTTPALRIQHPTDIPSRPVSVRNHIQFPVNNNIFSSASTLTKNTSQPQHQPNKTQEISSPWKKDKGSQPTLHAPTGKCTTPEFPTKKNKPS